MPGDRLLGTLLRSLQTYTDQDDTPRLLGAAVSLLTTLNNPLNVTLLCGQLLSAPAVWAQPDGLRTSTQCLSVFHSAAQALIRHEAALKEKKSSDQDFSELQLERTLPREDWVRAVVKGADERSPRWRHLLLLGGLLLGFGPPEEEQLSRSLRSTIEAAFVTAVNLALAETPEDETLGPQTLTMALNHCFPTLADHERARIDYDACLPVLLHSVLHSSAGLKSGYFLGTIDMDIQPVSGSKFRWPEHSATCREITNMASSPLLSALGPLSRLMAHCIDNVHQSEIVGAAVNNVEALAQTLHMQWRHNKLSEVDPSEESIYLDAETQEKSTPQLWKLLRSTLFAAVITLRAAIGRVLGDPVLAQDNVAPILAAQALRTLRHLCFISTRMNSASFSQYAFVSLTAMDILTTYPAQAEAFINYIKPTELSVIPKHPQDRCLDLFFLNTAEHFTLVLPSQVNENLLIASASPYLAAGGDNNLLPIFEAAHSVMLSVFSAPQNTDLTGRHLPFYVQALFNVFPANLSARQFRLAFKTLLRLTSPPAILWKIQPMMSAILLDLLYIRARNASTQPLFPKALDTHEPDSAASAAPAELSEQTVLTLTIIDTLSQIHLTLLEEWLPLTADLVNRIEDEGMREHCVDHFWRVLVDGEMDPDRSQICHAWWSTKGGREALLEGGDEGDSGEQMMSGGLGDEREGSKL